MRIQIQIKTLPDALRKYDAFGNAFRSATCGYGIDGAHGKFTRRSKIMTYSERFAHYLNSCTQTLLSHALYTGKHLDDAARMEIIEQAAKLAKLMMKCDG